MVFVLGIKFEQGCLFTAELQVRKLQDATDEMICASVLTWSARCQLLWASLFVSLHHSSCFFMFPHVLALYCQFYHESPSHHEKKHLLYMWPNGALMFVGAAQRTVGRHCLISFGKGWSSAEGDKETLKLPSLRLMAVFLVFVSVLWISVCLLFLCFHSLKHTYIDT